LTRLTNVARSLNLSVRAWVLVAMTGVGLVGSISVLAVTTEDVTQQNGMSKTDASNLRFFVEHRGDRVVQAAKLVTEAGAAPLLALVAVVAAALLWWRGARLLVAVAPAMALGLAGAAAAVAKQIVGRERPPVGLRLLRETEPSFPSGHATDSTALYLTLALVVSVFVFRRPIARAATAFAGVVLPAAVGVSRLVLGVHWPSDVLAGWALGVTTSLVVVLVVAASSRVTPPTSDSRGLRTRLLAVLSARRAPGLHAV
jgi:undecaprenyl-diphosphatase